MARNSLQAQLVLDRIRCHDKGDGIGCAEPYLWTVFFKVDGETVALGDDLFLHGRATVITTPGSHGNLGDVDVDDGGALSIPSAVGELVTTLRPIPVPGWITDAYGVEDVGGVIGAVAMLMEEDDVSPAGAGAGHTALDAFVQQALDGLIPTLGVTHPELTDDDVEALTQGAEEAIAEAIASAQQSWEGFAGWLNADDPIGHHVLTFGHDALWQGGLQAFSKRWRGEGDWELHGRVCAASTAPAEAVLSVLRSFGLVQADAERHTLQLLREFRRSRLPGNRELGAWWQLAQRNTASLAYVLRSDPGLCRGLVAPLMNMLAAAAIDPDAPLPDAAIVALKGLLQAFVEQGNRRLRIDAKAALGVVPKLRGESLASAMEVLAQEPATRKPRRQPLRRSLVRLLRAQD